MQVSSVQPVALPISSSIGPLSARKQGDAAVSEVQVTRSTDRATPELTQSAVRGDEVEDAEIDFVNSGAGSEGSGLDPLDMELAPAGLHVPDDSQGSDEEVPIVGGSAGGGSGSDSGGHSIDAQA